jgi:uncharacterized protein
MDTKSLKDSLIPFLEKHGVVRSALFGSIVRGEENAESDIDLLVEFEEGKSLFDLIDLKQEIEEAFHKRTDIVTYRSVHPLLKSSILESQEIIYDKKS